MRGPPFPLALAVFGIVSGSANASVTLYEISPTPTRTMAAGVHMNTFRAGTTTVYPIGTGSDGKTTYVQDNILSLLVVQYPLPDNPALMTTTTVISEAETVAVTFAEDNKGYHATRSVSLLTPAASGRPLAYIGGLDEQCTFNTNGSGSCIRVAIGLDASTHPVFSTTTYEGRVIPWYTITSTSTSTSTSTPTGNTAVAVRSNLAWALAGPVFVVAASYLTGVGLVARGSVVLL